MDITPKFKKAMNKDEVVLLVDLIQSNPVLTSRETNATTNKSKDETWSALVTAFNAKSGSVPRTKEQLKLKWDNLKKAARKRTAEIRMNNLKTGGGRADNIPADEVLEKVSSLLGSTGVGFMVPFGGDGVGSQVVDLVGDTNNDPDFGDGYNTNEDIVINSDIRPDVEFLNQTPSIAKQERKRKIIEGAGILTPTSSKYFFGTPLPNPLKAVKKGKNKENTGVTERNLAITRYYDKKTEKLDLEIKILKLELEKQEKNLMNSNDNIVLQ